MYVLVIEIDMSWVGTLIKAYVITIAIDIFSIGYLIKAYIIPIAIDVFSVGTFILGIHHNYIERCLLSRYFYMRHMS